MAVLHAVCAGQYDKSTCEFTIFTVLIGILCCIKYFTDLLKMFSVIAPLKPGLTASDTKS